MKTGQPTIKLQPPGLPRTLLDLLLPPPILSPFPPSFLLTKKELALKEVVGEKQLGTGRTYLEVTVLVRTDEEVFRRMVFK